MKQFIFAATLWLPVAGGLYAQSELNGGTSSSQSGVMSPADAQRRLERRRNHRLGTPTTNNQAQVQSSVQTVPTDSLGQPLPSNINNPTPNVSRTQGTPGVSGTLQTTPASPSTQGLSQPAAPTSPAATPRR